MLEQAGVTAQDDWEAVITTGVGHTELLDESDVFAGARLPPGTAEITLLGRLELLSHAYRRPAAAAPLVLSLCSVAPSRPCLGGSLPR